jgi:cytochrome c oxidase subunit 2
MIITSEDVLHDLYFPSFRVKTDAIPGRYTQVWFNATKPGKYHIFCAEYCGTKHAGMIGWVHVLPEDEYQAWLGGTTTGESLAQRGEKLFTQLACITCHSGTSQGRGPALNGLWGHTVQLANGNTVTADASYVRESILIPTAKIVAGYQPLMPTFQGQVTEEQLLALTEYIKGLPAVQTAPGAAPPATPSAPAPAAPPR